VERSLPTIDLSPYLSGGGSRRFARAATARALERACRDPGFFYLVGHGVPQDDVRALHGLTRKFFQQPQTTKEAIAVSRNPASGRGYQRLGENVTKGYRDWHEAIDFYAEPKEEGPGGVNLLNALSQSTALSASNGGSQGQSFKDVALAAEQMRPFVFGRNQWPSEPPELRGALEMHFQRLVPVGCALMEAMAEVFDLPADHFRPLTDRSFWCARAIGYPPLPEAEARVDVGVSCGEHTDYGCWTILSQDDTPDALEVQGSDGTWSKVNPVPGAFVVNLGDMLSVWTKGRFAATPHRVRQTRGTYRTSVAFFYEPNYDAIIRPLDTVEDPGESEAMALAHQTGSLHRIMESGGLVYGEHLYGKVSSNFDFGEQRQMA